MKTLRQTEKARIADIRVGPRIREDMGDIDVLAESLRTHGLIHPVVVDEDLNLIAGHRRLEAAKRIGWEMIEVRYLTDLSEREKRLIELEENIRRKDLTAYERSKKIVELVETAREVAREEFRSQSDQKPAEPGRPPKPDSERAVEEITGIARTTAHKAEAHVETAERYPFMQRPEWKQYHVLEAREALEKLPEDERPKAAAIVDEPGFPPRDAIRALRNIASKPPEERKAIYELSQSSDRRDRSLAKTKAMELPREPDPRRLALRDFARQIRSWVREFPNDPFNDDLLALAESMEDLDRRMKEAECRG